MVVTAVDNQYMKRKGRLQISKNVGYVTNKGVWGLKAGIWLTRLQKNEKTKTPAQTKSCKTNHIQSLKKEKNKVTLAPEIKTNSKNSCSTWEMVNSPNKKRAEEYELFTQGSDMTCRVDIMGKQVDSRSEVSLLKSSIFEDLKNSKMKLKGSDLTITQANGQKNEAKWYDPSTY